MGAVEQLNSVLHADLAEETYLGQKVLFATEAKHPLLVSIQSVEAVAIKPLQYSPDLLDVSSTWEVRGIVHHWGHSHTRTASVKGELRFSPVDGIWKCSSINTSSPVIFKVESDDESSS